MYKKNIFFVIIKVNIMIYIFFVWKLKIGFFFLFICVFDGVRVGWIVVGGENFVCFNLFRIVFFVVGFICKFIMYLLK